ncbi:MAG: HigA family addiction module antitoxin [Christensenellales bacterium]
MAGKKTGLFRELIIHPGETLREILDDRGMSQVELAHRTGVSETHVSNIINGQKDISVLYAKKLEYALGTDAKFWINLQANYDSEKMEFEDKNNILKDEFEVVKQLKSIVSFMRTIGIITSSSSDCNCVLELRKIFQISKLTDIPKVAFSGAFRIKEKTKTNVYVLFAWLKLCQIVTENIKLEDKLNIKKLIANLPKIKAIMFQPPEHIQSQLKTVFAECGIAFCVIKNFTGAPVHGYIRKNTDGTLMMAVTIRGAYRDIFWFSLFHEIGHVINGDIGSSCSYIDYNNTYSDEEMQADLFAANELINPKQYEQFIMANDFSLNAINEFSESQMIRNYILIGRLQKEGKIEYKQYTSEKLRYKWVQ